MHGEQDILSGVTVSFAVVPECVGFALVAGLPTVAPNYYCTRDTPMPNLTIRIMLANLLPQTFLSPCAKYLFFLAGVNPITALHGAAIMAFITSAIGGRPGMISGSAGAMVGSESCSRLYVSSYMSFHLQRALALSA